VTPFFCAALANGNTKEAQIALKYEASAVGEKLSHHLLPHLVKGS